MILKKHILLNFGLLAVYIIPQVIQIQHVIAVKHHTKNDFSYKINLITTSAGCAIHAFSFYISDRILTQNLLIINILELEIDTHEIAEQCVTSQLFHIAQRAPPDADF